MFSKPTIATDTYPLREVFVDRFGDRIVYIYGLEEHQLLFDPVDTSTQRLPAPQGEFIDGLCDGIAYIYGLEWHQSIGKFYVGLI